MVSSKNGKDKLGAHLAQVFYCNFKGLAELSLFIGKWENISGDREILKIKERVLKGSEQSQD